MTLSEPERQAKAFAWRSGSDSARGIRIFSLVRTAPATVK
jgi:hypothetical protein